MDADGGSPTYQTSTKHLPTPLAVIGDWASTTPSCDQPCRRQELKKPAAPPEVLIPARTVETVDPDRPARLF